MDALIAEKVFGVEVYNTARNPKEQFLPRSRQMLDGPSCGSCEQNGLGGDAYEIPYYSTDIAAAWWVVEKLHLEVGPWQVLGWRASTYHDWNDPQVVFAIGETAPLAICRAALKAVK